MVPEGLLHLADRTVESVGDFPNGQHLHRRVEHVIGNRNRAHD
nr:hypothetical protein [Kibdelosporangium sp. MJ126-NF4]CTQ96442.1 hypothetical protein [Kibdelosporangium sp. MJ126-NF4]